MEKAAPSGKNSRRQSSNASQSRMHPVRSQSPRGAGPGPAAPGKGPGPAPLAQLKAEIDGSARVQNLMALAEQIQPDALAQRKTYTASPETQPEQDSSQNPGPAALPAPSGPEAVAQLKNYASKQDPQFKVKTNSTNGGTFAEAREGETEYPQSSIEYQMLAYMNALDPPNTVRTRVPMATQTNTMHAYPERHGVGTLLAATAIEHMENRGIEYFQPDVMKSKGGNAMEAMISGRKRNAGYMEDLISQTDGRGGTSSKSCGCWEALKSCFCLGSSEPEEQPLLDEPQVRTYPAIEVDFDTTRSTLDKKVKAKFTEE